MISFEEVRRCFNIDDNGWNDSKIQVLASIKGIISILDKILKDVVFEGYFKSKTQHGAFPARRVYLSGKSRKERVRDTFAQFQLGGSPR
jgi:hypothetical protein